jgi:hypothetical protein
MATLVMLAAWLPPGLLDHLPTLCLFRNLAGWECPGCGMTRAVLSLLRGDLATALHYNRMVVLVFPLLCCLLLAELRSHQGAKTPRPW